MRIPRFRALALAGLLGLALANATRTSTAAGQACGEDSGSSRAVQLAKCNGGFADRQRLAEVYQQRLGLSADSAVRLADALAALQPLRDEASGPEHEQEIRRIESQFIALLDQAPDDPRIADEVGWFYAAGPWFSRAPSPSLLDLVARSSDPARLGSRLAQHGFGRAGAEILFAALAVRPEPAALWYQASQLTYDPAWKIALLQEAGRRLAPGEGGRPVDIATALAEELLETELDAGLVPQALATFQGLAPAVRSRIEQGTAGTVEAEIDGLSFEGRSRDLRLSLIAAYLLADDRQAAARLLAKIEPVPAAKARQAPQGRGEEGERQVFARWLHPSPDDPFDLLTTALIGDESVGTRTLALVRLAERERYPAIAAYGLSLLDRERSEAPFEPVRGVLPRVQAADSALRGEIETLRQSLAAEARADREAARTAFGPDPAAATVSRLLQAPAAVRFAEKPLPDGIAPVELTDDQLETRQKAMAAGMTLPAHFGLIRLERQGNRAAALGVSQDYDPVGEVSTGAYWVLLSSDGGRTWDPPLYTGLRVNQPYVVRAVSDLPLLADDHLQVEVEIAELDPARITFPPVALAPRRSAKGLYLDIPLDLLRKDSDGDGLTDLAEERLMTDPQSRDTDGDGLEDGVDPLPTVPLRHDAPSPATRALAAFLADSWNVSQAAIIEGVAAGPRSICCAKDRVRSVDEKTLFLIADRGLFSALTPPGRVLVLTPEEAEAATQKFGPFYPMKLGLFCFDRSGRRAYIIWSATWQGGQSLLEEKPDGTWKATPKTGWIT